MRKEEIQREVALTLDMMQSAPAQEFGYLVGKLSALLWVQHEGICCALMPMSRPVAPPGPRAGDAEGGAGRRGGRMNRRDRIYFVL